MRLRNAQPNRASTKKIIRKNAMDGSARSEDTL